jgi:hypothetical protein
MNRIQTFVRSSWFPILVLVLVSALVYLPRINQFSYFRDDWYYMYDGHVAGPSIFNEMFKQDRPIRGPFFGSYFSLFGTDPFPYAVGAYLWRLASGLGALWLFNLLFPQKTKNNLFAALLVLVYPGYLWWVAGIEYQPMIASFFFQVISIAFSLKAIASHSKFGRLMHIFLAVITGWYYLLLVDYAVGMEVFRILCIYLVVARKDQNPFFQKVKNTIKIGWPNLIVPLGYLFWRIFFFQNERRATDIGLQMGQLFSSPLTALWWMIHWVQSFLNVTLFAWTEPFSRNFFELRLQDMLTGLLLAALAAGIIPSFYFLRSRKITGFDEQPEDLSSWANEALRIGWVGTAIGILPIITANRTITFDRFSHYALPASLSASILMTAMFSRVSSNKFRIGVFSFILFLASLTHYSVAVKAVNEEKTIREFWWQVIWRAPSIRENTSLMVNYPSIAYGEDYEIVSGPANFIYYAKGSLENGLVHYPISGISMTVEGLNNILAGKFSVEKIVRSHVFLWDYGNVLVISQPAPAACIHVVDANWKDVSISELEGIRLVSPQSKIDNVQTEVPTSSPPVSLFGNEPEHTWCYFYQKAALARQLGDWEQIANFEKQASKLGLHPNDQIEWMPFLQAAAMLGDENAVKQLSTRINTERLYKQQACQNLQKMKLSPDMQSYVSGLFCKGN